MKWEDEQSMLSEVLSNLSTYGVQWTRIMSSDNPGPKLTDEWDPEYDLEPEYEIEQLDFEEIWAEKLRNRYGIRDPFAD